MTPPSRFGPLLGAVIDSEAALAHSVRIDPKTMESVSKLLRRAMRLWAITKIVLSHDHIVLSHDHQSETTVKNATRLVNMIDDAEHEKFASESAE